MQDLFLVSLTSSVVIALLLVFLPHTEKRYGAKWRVLIWILLAARLLLPFRIELPAALIQVPVVENRPIAYSYQTGGYVQDTAPSPDGKTLYLPEATNTVSLSLYDLIFLLWLVGAAAYFAFHIINYIVFVCRIHGKRKAFDVQARLPVFVYDGIAGPLLYGYFKPYILLPHVNFSVEELSMVLCHEQMHHRRGDLWVKLLLLAANAVHWFNPMVYFAVRRANRDLEYACDEAVLQGMDLEFRKAYARTILKTMKGEEDENTVSDN